MLELFIGNKNYSSWSLRPWVLMKERGVPFTERLQPFTPGGSPGFKAFSPSGRVPCLRDGELVVWDSLAIVEYVAEQHPGVWPASTEARAWARSAAAEMHSSYSALRNQCSMSCGVRVQLKRIDAALRADLDRLAEVWSQGLERFGGPFLAGASFTAVDAFFCPVAFRVQTYRLPLPPPLLDYANRLLALPSMRAWYDAGLAETWRDAAHDDEVLLHGTVVEDLRARPLTPRG